MCDVAIVCGAGTISGKEIMALELLAGLREQRKNVDVISSSWGQSEFRARCEQLGARVHVMRLGFISATLSWSAIRMTLHQLLHWPGLGVSYSGFLKTARPPKIIHTNWHHLLLLAPFLKPERDIFWVHEVIPEKWQYRELFRQLERRLKCFVAVSHAVAESLRKIDIGAGKIRVVHNGISDPTAGVLERRQSDKRIVGIVGQIGPWKGHEDLLEAFATIAPEFPTTEVHIFGRGRPAYEQKLRERVAALGIGERIRWRGFVLDRAAIYRDLNICVVPSRSAEPLPTVAIEAAFFGIPVIATRQGGLPEIVDHEQTGFLVEPAHRAELAWRLKLLLGDNAVRRAIGENARRKALQKFERKRFVEDFVCLMEEN
jgi:glycosyltransferase involved in cell wall biosynthesis